MVIINKKEPKVSIFELTVPSEQRIEISNKLKSDKYQHFITDITSHTVTVTPFEIGSHTGYISTQNKKNLADLHKFCKKDIKLKTFIQNISAVTILSSYYLFNCRNDANWDNPGVIKPPLSK